MSGPRSHTAKPVRSGGVPGTLQARGRVRREAILAAARTLFAQRGYEGTSLRDVAEVVGLSDAGLLFHFPSKTNLLLAVIADGDAKELDALRALLNGAKGLEALRKLTEWGAGLERDPVLLALDVVLSAENMQAGSQVNGYYAERYEGVRKRLASFFHQARSHGDFAPDTDPELEATQMLAMLDGLRLQWFLSKGAISIADSMRAYMQNTIERLSRRR